MKERPILFSGEMVRAILDGRKTQTRRIIKPQPHFIHDNGFVAHIGKKVGNVEYLCKYGQPGDRLWVRESYRIGAWDEECEVFALDYCDGAVKQWLTPSATETEDSGEVFERIWISCCDELSRKGIEPEDDGQYRWMPGDSPLNWRPSIHMPRWASRITLEITGVWVERLQDISEEDAEAEGCKNSLHLQGGRFARENFEHLWWTINGDGSWEENPWVWVISFRKI